MVSRSGGQRWKGASRASRRSTPRRLCSSRPRSRPMRWLCGRSTNGEAVFLLDAPLVARRVVARGMFVLSLDAPQIANSVPAGQFVNLGWAPGPLLRRPCSVYRADGDRTEGILKAVGAGTSQLLSLAARDTISCLGPLGHGFELPSPLRGEGQGEGRRARSVALVSGGLGVAPMPLAARAARPAGVSGAWGHRAPSAERLCS